MRNKVNILWLHDENKGASIVLKDLLSSSCLQKGYQTNFIDVSNLKDALSSLNNPKLKIDFFVSDYNLGKKDASNDTGLDFLNQVRTNGHNKEFFVLYSNYEIDRIQRQIYEDLKKEILPIENLNNFYMISLSIDKSQKKKEIDRCIDLALCRWDELNALRGEFAYASSSIEWITRKLLKLLKNNSKYERTNYKDHAKVEKDLISYSKSLNVMTFTDIDNIKIKWDEIRKIRNDLEHNFEQFNESTKQYEIKGSLFTYQENSVCIYRNKLIDFINVFKNFIKSINQLNNSIDSVVNSDLVENL